MILKTPFVNLISKMPFSNQILKKYSGFLILKTLFHIQILKRDSGGGILLQKSVFGITFSLFIRYGSNVEWGCLNQHVHEAIFFRRKRKIILLLKCEKGVVFYFIHFIKGFIMISQYFIIQSSYLQYLVTSWNTPS